MKKMKIESINFKSKVLQQDDLFVSNEKVSLEKLTGKPCRKGLSHCIVSNGKIVNAVSSSYGHLPNEKFFLAVEEKLINADIHYTTRSINREDCNFAADYILNDDSFAINVKNSKDVIKPMLRFINSYDGQNKVSGHLGFFREICSNGLHVAHSVVGFSFRKRGDIEELVLPEIQGIITQFMNNEFYTLTKKFEKLKQIKIKRVEDFVKVTCEKNGLFKYEKSDKNPAPSLNAQIAIDIINHEAQQLGEPANLWLGYNAMQSLIHDKLQKSFDTQKKLEQKLFADLMTYTN